MITITIIIIIFVLCVMIIVTINVSVGSHIPVLWNLLLIAPHIIIITFMIMITIINFDNFAMMLSFSPVLTRFIC